MGEGAEKVLAEKNSAESNVIEKKERKNEEQVVV